MSTTSRRVRVLKAIVVEHVQTREPVSSRAVAEGHVSGVSSATIRSDMGALERQGLITQPHTSAGRVPTDAGYRSYVDNLGSPTGLQGERQKLIVETLRGSGDTEEAVARAASVLSTLTGQAAVAQYPDLSLSGIKRVELVDLPPNRLLVLVISTSGRIAERILEFSNAELPTEGELRALAVRLTQAAAGKDLSEAKTALKEAMEESSPELQDLAQSVREAIFDIFRPLVAPKAVTAGASKLARPTTGFSDPSAVLETLEDQAELARVLSEIHSGPLDVSIGEENLSEPLNEAAVVSATYSGGGGGSVHVGVLGPTRMDYPLSLAAVQAVSRCLTELLLGTASAEESGTSEVGPVKEGTE